MSKTPNTETAKADKITKGNLLKASRDEKYKYPRDGNFKSEQRILF